MKIWIVEDYVQYEGGSVLAIYDHEADALAHVAECKSAEHYCFGQTFSARAYDTLGTFTPAAPAPGVAGEAGGS